MGVGQQGIGGCQLASCCPVGRQRQVDRPDDPGLQRDELRRRFLPLGKRLGDLALVLVEDREIERRAQAELVDANVIIVARAQRQIGVLVCHRQLKPGLRRFEFR